MAKTILGRSGGQQTTSLVPVQYTFRATDVHPSVFGNVVLTAVLHMYKFLHIVDSDFDQTKKPNYKVHQT